MKGIGIRKTEKLKKTRMLPLQKVRGETQPHEYLIARWKKFTFKS